MSTSSERLRFKDRILESLSKAIKNIQQEQFLKDDGEPIILHNEDVACSKLCEQLDNVFLHGLRHLHNGYWKVVSEFTRKDAVKELRTLQHITTDLGRSRAWLLMALNECCLECYIKCYEDNKKTVMKYYSRDALLLDQQNINILLTLTAGLEHAVFQLAIDEPYLDIGTVPPRSRSRTNSEVDDDRVSLCSMDSVMSCNIMQRTQACSTPSESLHSASDNSETTSVHSIETQSVSHGTQENKGDRLDNLVQETAEEEEEDNIGVQVIRVKGQGKVKHGKKKKFRKNGKERKSPVCDEHIKEENEDETDGLNENVRKNSEISVDSGSPNAFYLRLSSEQKLKEILTDNSSDFYVDQHKTLESKSHHEDDTTKSFDQDTINKEPETMLESSNIHDNSLDTRDIDLYSSNTSQKSTENVSVDLNMSTKSLVNKDFYTSSEFSKEDGESSLLREAEQCQNSELVSGSTSENIGAHQATTVIYEDLPEGDIQLTVTNSTQDFSTMEYDNIECSWDADKHPEDCDSKETDANSKEDEDDIYSSNEKSFTSALQDKVDDIIYQSDAVLHQHMFEEEPEESKPQESEGENLSLAEVELDNNTKLHLMLDVFDNAEEQYIKMFATRVGHTDGDPQPVFVLITDRCLYLLNQEQSDYRFVKETSIPFINIDFISLSIDSQVVHIKCTNKRIQYWLTTGCPDISHVIVDSIQSIVDQTSEHKVPVLNDATTQRIALRKYLNKEYRFEGADAEITCYSLVFWDDPTKGNNFDSAFKEGHLLYKVQSPPSSLSGHLLQTVQDPLSLLYGQTWKSAYVVLKDGLLCLYNVKSDNKPFLFIQMRGEDCVGCRRVTNTDRDHCIEIIKADNSTVQMSLANTQEANSWLQCLCQAVAEGLQSTAAGSKPSCLPCCSILTPLKILMCHEDMQASFFRTLGSANVEELTSVYIDSTAESYCILEFESHDSSVSTERWVFFFVSKSERDRYVKALSKVWALQFEVEVPVIELEDFSLQRKCRETVQSLNYTLTVKK